METSAWAVGSLCWAPDDHLAYAEAQVVEVSGRAITVTVEDVGVGDVARRQHAAIELLPRARDSTGVADMDQLPELNEAAVLGNIARLYAEERIYSSVGPVLIAMNPFSTIPGLYSKETAAAYRTAGATKRAWNAPPVLRPSVARPSALFRPLGPHCYETAELAYSGLRSVRQQSVVVCGESGAGKSETNRLMLEYLCAAGGESSPGSTNDTLLASGAAVDPCKITEVNVVLESFGNAKTVRNDNSSRFGRYTKLFFDSAQYVVRGCAIDHYLLERSRVVVQPRGERNYHVFYQLLRSDAAAKYSLEGGQEAFEYTKACAALPGLDDAADFSGLQGAMAGVGLPSEARDSVFGAVAAVLHLGNVDFSGDSDTSKVAPAAAGALASACRILGVDPEALGHALTVRLIKAAGSRPIEKNLGVQAARAQRDTVAKSIYSRAFDQLVDRVNDRLAWSRPRPSAVGRGGASEDAMIGLLDIFGFEDMPVNGFEQLFINMTNERIQYLFNDRMFRSELEVYRLEGLPDIIDTPPSNTECIELFNYASKPAGIVKLLAEQCATQSGDGSDRDGAPFVAVLNRAFAKHPFYEVCDPQEVRRLTKEKAARWKSQPAAVSLDYRECFEIRHYVGPVIYTVRDFVAKSRDSLHEHLASVLATSSCRDVRALFVGGDAAGSAAETTPPLGSRRAAHFLGGGAASSAAKSAPPVGSRGASVREATVGEKFCRDLDLLATRLSRSDLLFVRCIKPNPEMLPLVVDRPFVLNQLLSGGVVAALEMRHAGFPERMEYRDFCHEFFVLEDRGDTDNSLRHRVELLLGAFFPWDAQRYALGHTRVFMKGGSLAFLQAAVGIRKLHMANVVRRRWRIHKGTQAIRAIEDDARCAQAAEELARAAGVAEFGFVAKALRDALSATRAALEAFHRARAEHGEDVERIAAALRSLALGDVRKEVVAAEHAVERASAQKAEAERLLALQLDKARQRAQLLFDRVASVEQRCASAMGCEVSGDSALPPEWSACAAACHAARARIDAIVREELPAVRGRGPPALQASATSEPPAVLEPRAANLSLDPRSAIGLLIEGAVHLVVVAEERLQAAEALRERFFEATAAPRERWEQARNRLEALQGEARESAAGGKGGAGEAAAEAWRLDAEVERLHCTGEGAEVFSAAVAAFDAAVEAASTAAERDREQRVSDVRDMLRSGAASVTQDPGQRVPEQEREHREHAAPQVFEPPHGSRQKRSSMLPVLEVGILRMRVVAAHNLLDRGGSVANALSRDAAMVRTVIRIGDYSERTDALKARRTCAWNSREFAFPVQECDRHLDLEIVSTRRGAEEALGRAAVVLEDLPRNEWQRRRERLEDHRSNGELEVLVRFEVFEECLRGPPLATWSASSGMSGASVAEEAALRAELRDARARESRLRDALREAERMATELTAAERGAVEGAARQAWTLADTATQLLKDLEAGSATLGAEKGERLRSGLVALAIQLDGQLARSRARSVLE